MSTRSTTMSSPIHCCKALVIANSAVAASTSLFGSKTRSRRPQPNSGRLTRSPGEVSTSSRILARIFSLPLIRATCPTSLIRNGNAMLVLSISLLLVHGVAGRKNAVQHGWYQRRRRRRRWTRSGSRVHMRRQLLKKRIQHGFQQCAQYHLLRGAVGAELDLAALDGRARASQRDLVAILVLDVD